MAANGNKECKAKSHMLWTEVGEKTQVKLDSNNMFETSYEFDPEGLVLQLHWPKP